VKNLNHLHEEFIEKARRPMTFGRLPINPIEGDIAIVAVDKWITTSNPRALKKSFRFMSIERRNTFVKKLLQYEAETLHNATTTIDESSVTIVLFTKDINTITELDKEYAKYADLLYKDVVYNPVNE
jgi:pterin-4a-carbinolamine dehydratase